MRWREVAGGRPVPRARTAAISPAVLWPRPIATIVPTTARTIWWQKELDSISNRTTSSPASVPARIEDPAGHRVVPHSLRRTTERREIVLADDRIAGEREDAPVEWIGNMPCRSGKEGVGHGAVEHRVAIASGASRTAGVEAHRRDVGDAHDDLGPTPRVHGPPNLVEVEVSRGRRRVEMHDLAPGMHAGIGTTGAGEGDRMPQHQLERTGQGAPHGGDPVLDCEPVELTPVVGDDQADTKKWGCSRRLFEERHITRTRCAPSGRCPRDAARA